jgi:putative endonuclease
MRDDEESLAYAGPNNMIEKEYSVYIMTNKSFTLYVGVTNDIMSRAFQHRSKTVKGFTSKYNIDKLLYVETSSDVSEAIKREKQIKGWTRQKKMDLIKTTNPEFKDLGKEWDWY